MYIRFVFNETTQLVVVYSNKCIQNSKVRVTSGNFCKFCLRTLYDTSSYFSIVVDIDECTTGRCHEYAECLNTPGSFECKCKLGFVGNGFSCTSKCLLLI